VFRARNRAVSRYAFYKSRNGGAPKRNTGNGERIRLVVAILRSRPAASRNNVARSSTGFFREFGTVYSQAKSAIGMSCNAVTAVIAHDGLPALRLFVIARISAGTLPGVSHVCQTLAWLSAITSSDRRVPPRRRSNEFARKRVSKATKQDPASRRIASHFYEFVTDGSTRGTGFRILVSHSRDNSVPYENLRVPLTRLSIIFRVTRVKVPVSLLQEFIASRCPIIACQQVARVIPRRHAARFAMKNKLYEGIASVAIPTMRPRCLAAARFVSQTSISVK